MSDPVRFQNGDVVGAFFIIVLAVLFAAGLVQYPGNYAPLAEILSFAARLVLVLVVCSLLHHLPTRIISGSRLGSIVLIIAATLVLGFAGPLMFDRFEIDVAVWWVLVLVWLVTAICDGLVRRNFSGQSTDNVD